MRTFGIFFCPKIPATIFTTGASQVAQWFKKKTNKQNPACLAGDEGSIYGTGRSPQEGNGNPLQYSCLGNPMTKDLSGLQSMGLQRVRHS